MADVKVVAVGRMLIRILSSLRHYICHLLFFYFLFIQRMKSHERFGVQAQRRIFTYYRGCGFCVFQSYKSVEKIWGWGQEK